MWQNPGDVYNRNMAFYRATIPGFARDAEDYARRERESVYGRRDTYDPEASALAARRAQEEKEQAERERQARIEAQARRASAEAERQRLEAELLEKARATFRTIPATELAYSTVSLGCGGFGEVFVGRYLGLDVAIKKLVVPRLTGADCKVFGDEVTIHAGIRHPNIVRLMAACLEQGNFALVMEYMTGGSLHTLLISDVELPWDRRIDMAMQIVAGVVFLHANKITHRDLKSLNVLLERPYPDYGQLKLCDFGLAKIRSETRKTTTRPDSSKAVTVAGTLGWMPPEAFIRYAKLTEKSDVYALGMVLWELAARKAPYEDAENDDVARGFIKDGETEDFPEDTDRPEGYERVVRSCWSKNPEERPDAMDLLPQLETLAATAGFFAGRGRGERVVAGAGVSVSAGPEYGTYSSSSLGRAGAGGGGSGAAAGARAPSGPQYAAYSSPSSRK